MSRIIFFLLLLFLYLQFLQAQVESDSANASQSYHKDGLQIISLLIYNQDFFKQWNSPEMRKISPVLNYSKGDLVIPVIIFSTDKINSSRPT
jgi:hypothetical protein